MAGSWGLISKTVNTNLNNTNYPACWEDSGKVYCKGQGEYDITVYDIITETWSTLVTLSSVVGSGAQAFSDTGISQELLWTYGSTLYILNSGVHSDYQYHPRVGKYNISNGSTISILERSAQLGVNDGSMNGNFGRNRHKTVVKTSSGRIFIINWSLKQIWEFLPVSDTFVNCNVTWPSYVSYAFGCTAGAGGPTACAMGDNIYMFGAGTSYGDGNLSCGFYTTTGTAWVFTRLDNFTHTNIGGNSYNTQYSDGSVATIGNFLYLFGGVGKDQLSNPFYFRYIKKLDPSASTGSQWSDVVLAPSTQMIKMSAVTSTSAAYIIGGTISGSTSQAVNAFTYLLDTPTSFQGVYNPLTMAVDLTWIDNSNEETNYIIDRKRDDELTWSELVVLSADTLTYSDTTVNIHQHFYEYRLCCEKAM
jgi:hypothetical protein